MISIVLSGNRLNITIMKEIDRSKAKEISQRVQATLESLSKELGVSFKVGSCSFTSDSFNLKIEGNLLSEDGKAVVSSDTHFMANGLATSAGMSFKGNFIGSVWMVDDKFYCATGVKVQNRKYPCIVRDGKGKSLKSTFDFLKKGTQVYFPTEKEFLIWCTIDPEEDSVRESDVEIYDKVQGYICTAYTKKDGDDIIDIIERAHERFSVKARNQMFKDFYKQLSESPSISEVIEFGNFLLK